MGKSGTKRAVRTIQGVEPTWGIFNTIQGVQTTWGILNIFLSVKTLASNIVNNKIIYSRITI